MISQETNLTGSWKHPWSLDEIINSSRSWSLAADYGVCELLKKFSTDILNEVTQLNNNINELSIESKQTNVVIQNAFNDFCMLANNQFMENLVEDANSSLLNEKDSKEPEDNSFNKGDKVAQLNMQVSESIKLGIQVLENQFEILDVQRVNRDALVNQDSDSEHVTNSPFEGGNNEPIYHPKDPYEHRHLPHLIGTTEFVEDETLGIGYLDELEDGSEDFEIDSDHSERNELLDDLSSNLSGDPAAEYHEISHNRKKYSSDSDSSFDKKSKDIEDNISRESDDLFNYSNINTSVKQVSQDSVPVKTLTVQEQLQEQLKKKLGLNTTISSSSHGGSTVDIPAGTADSDILGLDDETAAMYSTVPVQHSRENFLESDDDNKSIDLFPELPTSIKKTAAAPSIAKQISVPIISGTDVTVKSKTLDIKPLPEVLSDSDDDIFKSCYKKVPVATISTPIITAKRQSPIRTLNLDSDSDSDNDIFKEKLVPKAGSKQGFLSKSSTVPLKDKLVVSSLNKPAEKSLPKISSFILDDDDDEDDFENLFKPSIKKPVTKAISLITNKDVPIVKDDLDPGPLFQVGSSGIVSEVAKASAGISSDFDENSNRIEQPSSIEDKMGKPEPIEKKFLDNMKPNSPNTREKIIPKFSEDSDKDLFDDMFTKELPASIKIKAEIPVTVVEEMKKTTSIVVETDPLNQKTGIPQAVIPETNPLKHEEPNRKLPAGAVDPFSNLFPSKNILSELHQIMKPSTITEQAQVETTSKPLPQGTRENPLKSGFADILQQSLSRPRPIGIPIKSTQSQLSKQLEEPDINLEEPVQKVNQLTLLTKSRARNMPRRRPTTKMTSDNTESNTIIVPDLDNKEMSNAILDLPSNIPNNPIHDSVNIFSDLPPRTEKKSKINKKSKKVSRPTIDVNIEDIDDIFAIPNSKASKRAKSKVIDDPLGAM